MGLFHLCFVISLVVANYPHEAVRLSDVKTLVLKAGHMTTGRRSSPVEQIKCVGGPCGDDAAREIRVIMCENKGFDGRDVTWACTATLPTGYHLETTDVSCEGFTHPDDPFILVGSCGVEYVIRGSKPQVVQPQVVHSKPKDLDPASIVIIACVGGILVTMVFIAICTESRPQPQQPVQQPVPIYNYPAPAPAPAVVHTHHHSSSSSNHNNHGYGSYASGFVDATVISAVTQPHYRRPRSPTPVRYSAPSAPVAPAPVAPAPVAPVATSAPSIGYGTTKRR